jgi:hypothetical protein
MSRRLKCGKSSTDHANLLDYRPVTMQIRKVKMICAVDGDAAG